MIKLKGISYLLLLLALPLFFGCKKACNVPTEIVQTGDIAPESQMYGHNVGYERSIIRAKTDNFADRLKVSFNGGYSYNPIDFNSYLALSFPVRVSCNTTFERDVTISHSTKQVIYTLTEISCNDCESYYRVDNWVCVKTFPSNYSVVYVHEKQ